MTSTPFNKFNHTAKPTMPPAPYEGKALNMQCPRLQRSKCQVFIISSQCTERVELRRGKRPHGGVNGCACNFHDTLPEATPQSWPPVVRAYTPSKTRIGLHFLVKFVMRNLS